MMADGSILPVSATAGFAITAALFAFVYYRGVALVGIYARHGYKAERFLKWVVRERNFDKNATLIVLLAYIAWYFTKDLYPDLIDPLFYVLVFTALIVGARTSRQFIRNQALSEQPVSHDQNVVFAYMVLTAAYFASIFANQADIRITPLTLSFLAFFQAPPIFIIASHFVVRPLTEAKDKESS